MSQTEHLKSFGTLEKRLIAFTVVLLAAVVVAGVTAGILMIFQNKAPVNDALWVMGIPFIAVGVLGMTGAGIYSYTRNNAQAASLRLRIIGILGLVLTLSIVGILILIYQDKSVPDALIALASSIAGGLIGFLNPPSSGSGQDGGGTPGVTTGQLADPDTDPAKP